MMEHTTGVDKLRDCMHLLDAVGEGSLPPRFCPSRELILFPATRKRADESAG
jgi:hypothetical protein